MFSKLTSIEQQYCWTSVPVAYIAQNHNMNREALHTAYSHKQGLTTMQMVSGVV